MNIETLNEWGGRFLDFAWPMLWQSSLLIVLVFSLDLLLARKIRAAVRYALWLTILVKLLLPPTLALPTSAAWWLLQTKPAAEVSPARITITYGVPEPQPEFVSRDLPPMPKPRLDDAGCALIASVAVSAGLLLLLLVRCRQMNGNVRKAAEGGHFADAFEAARQISGLRSRIKLKMVDDHTSPAVYGLFAPVILLPRILAEKLSPQQLRTVLLHELIHLRRADVWVNCAQTFLQIFYWWHPLLWFANARIRRVREEAVDDAVMLALRDETDLYAPTLLEVAKHAFYRPRLSLGLVGIMESRSALRQRIERLIHFQAPRQAGLTWVSILGILMFFAVIVPMGCSPARHKDNKTVQSDLVATNLELRAFDLSGTPFPGFVQKANGGRINNVATAAKIYFGKLGVDWDSPKGKKIAYNEQHGVLDVRATERDFDTIEGVLSAFNTNAWIHQVHIKARFIEVPHNSMEWATNQTENASGILNDDSFRKILLALEKQPGVMILAVPEVVTISGRQTQMRTTDRQMTLTNYTHEETSSNLAIIAQTGDFEIGPIVDAIPQVFADNRTISMHVMASLTGFLGYDQPTNEVYFYTRAGKKLRLPTVSPAFSVSKASADLNIYDGQTIVFKLNKQFFDGGSEVNTEPNFIRKSEKSPDEADKEIWVFVTVNLVDPAGNRVHSDADTASDGDQIPPQPKNAL